VKVASSVRHWRVPWLPDKVACSAKHYRATVVVSEGRDWVGEGGKAGNCEGRES
jgi:hypothetical protein